MEEVNGWEVLEWGGDEEDQLEVTPTPLTVNSTLP